MRSFWTERNHLKLLPAAPYSQASVDEEKVRVEVTERHALDTRQFFGTIQRNYDREITKKKKK